ncbi:terpene synthase family protein [Streptomyces syringium]|uniref:terpene synthase family protein n=1 Tax=Streptomyces syringium TaxID=76729 RepID=UPI003AAE8214
MDDIIETRAPGQDRCPPLAAVPRAEPVTIRLPPLGRGLVATRHPQAAEVSARVLEWAGRHLSFLPLSEEELRYSLRPVVLFPEWAYPSAPVERFADLSAFTTYFFAIDDTLDNLRGGDDGDEGGGHRELIRSAVDACVRAHHGEPDLTSPWVAAYADVLDGVRRRMTPEQYTRLTSVCEEWFEACVRALDTPLKDPDLETYVTHRLLTAAAEAAFGLVEYATATDVAGLRRADADLEALCRASGRFGVLVNDLFSYRRDLFSGGPVVNAVTVLQQSEGLTLQGAVDRLCEELDAAEAALHTAHDKVLAGPLGERPDVRAFVKGVREMTAGNLRFSATTPRYHGVRLNLDPQKGSILRLTAERTLVLSVEERTW